MIMNTKYIRALVLCSALAVPALSFAGSVHMGLAGAQADAVTVSYKDLDLNTQVGAQTLYQRIASAAQQVCPSVDSAELARYMNSLECRQQVIKSVVERINNPQLTAVSAAHSGLVPTPKVAWMQPAASDSSLAQ